jgi:hypothetical protein
MALDSKNNIKSVFIFPIQATVPAAGTRVTPGSLAPDSVVLTNMSNEVLNTAASGNFNPALYDKIKIIKDRGANNPLQQVVLTRSQIATASSVAGRSASEQVDFIGYNGTAGTIQVLPINFYLIKLEHVPNQFAYGKRPANYKYGTYQSPAGLTQNAAGQLNVANGLINSLVTNFRPNRTTDWRVKSELVASDTTTAFGATTAVTMVFTKYSKSVTVTTGAAVSTTIAAGTYLRIGGTTATTAPIYRVATGVTALAATSTGTIILETVYQGDTATITVAGGVTFIASLAGDMGIKITGLKQKYDVNRWRQYDKVRFNTFLEGFPNTSAPTVVTTSAAFDGVAVYEQVANDEYISWGDEGQVFVDQVPPLFREQDAVVGQQYQPAVIGWLDRLPSLIGAGENKGQAIVYFAGGTGAATYTPTAGELQAAFITSFNLWSNVDLPTTFVY